MAKPKKKPSKSRDAYPKLPDQTPPASPAQSHAIRETVESIVIAFVLAFLFRTFEAEAFVIPTGSMAPTLMGRHKDVDCPQCGYRFRINASEEDAEELQNGGLTRQERRQLAASTCLAGMCPNCRYVMPLQPQLPPPVPELHDGTPIAAQTPYNGDRILVNKYLYTFSDPRRWDVVVFHFPGDAKTNYIKRLVGLPGEVVRVYQGDLFVAANPGSREADALATLSDADFTIARKPADTVLAMRQLVHDTDYDPAALYEAGWPLRWQPEPSDAAGWQRDAKVTGRNVRQSYSVDATDDATDWLRYRHVVPNYDVWRQVVEQRPLIGDQPQPQLITDFNAYNSRVSDLTVSQNRPPSLKPDHAKLGLNWVGDLMVEAEVEVESDGGELLLDLVEAGRHFTATIDLATGRATLAIDGSEEFSATADTLLSKPGRYHVALANVDDQLLLWIDHELVEFGGSAQYDADQLFGSRNGAIPRTSEADPGDLAPAGIGARGAKLTVTRLALWRDIYYIADSWKHQSPQEAVTDFDHPFDRNLLSLPFDPTLWHRFRERKHVEFPLEKDQFFVMGDNSPESSDARLWLGPNPKGGRPGGAYLERQQLIGKALCVYWPHSWSRIPGTPIPFPLFPNFADMRLVR